MKRGTTPGKRAASAIRRIAAALPAAVLVAGPLVAARPASAQAERFRHELHASFQCAECHQTGRATTTANGEWCADCHHVNASPGECARCHATGRITPAPARPLVTFRFSVGEPKTRPVPFDHERHGSFECGECHAGGADLGVRRTCASCHADHHEAELDCTACHAPPEAGVHPADRVHLQGCAGAGCHAVEELDYDALKESRSLCLSCHQGLRDHEAPESCVRCHLLGASGAGPGGRGS